MDTPISDTACTMVGDERIVAIRNNQIETKEFGQIGGLIQFAGDFWTNEKLDYCFNTDDDNQLWPSIVHHFEILNNSGDKENTHHSIHFIRYDVSQGK